MKKSLLALAVLGAFAGAASAQSSVTLYGLIDANLGKSMGSNQKRMGQFNSSRLGFRGVEDLGGGLSAIFQLENRYRPWNGTINGGNSVNGSPVTLWQARSYVGLAGGFGSIKLGREYDAAFFTSEVISDPWGWNGVVSDMTLPIMSGSGSSNFNVNRAVTYASPNWGGFSFAGQIAERDDNCGKSGLSASGATASTVTGAVTGTEVGTPVFGTCVNRPYSFGATYAGGPFSAGFGYNNPGNVNDKYMSFNLQYNLGFLKLWGFAGTGRTTTDAKINGQFFGITTPIGAGELRAAYMRQKVAGTTTISGLGLGYEYFMSKRTSLYTNFSHNGKLSYQKNGYEFGLAHKF